jgi:hypothetical protein
MAISQLREKDSRQMAVGRKCGTADYRTRKKEKMPRVLREPPFDRLRVVRELEPQDPDRSTQRLSTGGNRGAKTQRAQSVASAE